MKRVILCVVIVTIAILGFVIYLVFNTDVGARLFFGVDRSPVAISFKQRFDVPPTDAKTLAIVDAAMKFLDSLDDAQKRVAMYAFTDNAQRSNWSNFPEGMVPRGGIKLGELSISQRQKLDALLGELLSEYGFEYVSRQLAVEDLLIPQDFLAVMKYGSHHFAVAFLGEPSTTQPWTFQFGGHHLAINATVFGPHVSFSPLLTGGQPLHLQEDGDEIFIARREASAAKALMDSLTIEQKSQAIQSDVPIDLLLGPGKYGESVRSEGISGRDLTDSQRSLLLGLVEARLGLINRDDYHEKLATVVEQLQDTYFGWWGKQDVLGSAYFRVTSPSIVIEYAIQNGDGTVDHLHSMYRDLDNDYGVAWIGID